MAGYFESKIERICCFTDDTIRLLTTDCFVDAFAAYKQRATPLSGESV
jgi:hypothetical protein